MCNTKALLLGSSKIKTNASVFYLLLTIYGLVALDDNLCFS